MTAAQAEQIRSSGLASHVTNQDLLVIGEDGPIDNHYRFTNECARHKTLDLIGDLALAGVELVGRFISFRGGHNLNGRMAKQLSQLAAQQAGECRSFACSVRIRIVAKRRKLHDFNRNPESLHTMDTPNWIRSNHEHTLSLRPPLLIHEPSSAKTSASVTSA